MTAKLGGEPGWMGILKTSKWGNSRTECTIETNWFLNLHTLNVRPNPNVCVAWVHRTHINLEANRSG